MTYLSVHRLLLPRPKLRNVWLAVMLLYSASCIILPIIWKGEWAVLLRREHHLAFQEGGERLG